MHLVAEMLWDQISKIDLYSSSHTDCNSPAREEEDPDFHFHPNPDPDLSDNPDLYFDLNLHSDLLVS